MITAQGEHADEDERGLPGRDLRTSDRHRPAGGHVEPVGGKAAQPRQHPGQRQQPERDPRQVEGLAERPVADQREHEHQQQQQLQQREDPLAEHEEAA